MRHLSSTVSSWLPRENSLTGPLTLILLAACLAAPVEGNAQSRVEGVGSITGRVFDEQGALAAGVRVTAFRYVYNDYGARVVMPPDNAVTNMAGEFRIPGLRPGEYIVAVEREPVPTFYPGTEDSSKAVPVRIHVGEEYVLDDIRILSPRPATVRLHIIDSTGEPKPARTVSWSVSSAVAGNTGSFLTNLTRSVLPGITYFASVSADDEARIPNLPPGTYQFAVGWETSKGPVSGHTTVEVRGPDVERDLEVRPNRRLTVRVLLEEGDTETSPLANVTAMLLGGSVAPSNGRYFGATQADGAFVIDGVPEGSYGVRFFDLSADAYAASAMEGTHDTLTQPLRITGETTLTVFVRRDGGTVDGVVTDSRATKIPDAIVALVPDGLAREEVNRYRNATTDPNGEFTIQGITPGSYHLFAWPELDGAAYRNAAFMSRYDGKGEPVHVQRGDHFTVQVQLEDN